MLPNAAVMVEFTIEPFVEGAPGPHVTAAVAAVEALGVTVEFGPFGTTLRATAGEAGRVVAALLDVAYANGATHVSIHIGPDGE
ncbi:MAG: hypothetical protein FJW44_07370 [Actinobacteria bacterium]|nr:hypothetical protein [Actinomycetota bacterium]